MRSYALFPGCSGDADTMYYRSAQAVCPLLDIELIEIEDWNCCGATPYISINNLEATCVAARNLALAQKTGLDLVTSCSCCYVIQNQTDSHLREYPELREKVSEALAAGGLQYQGGVRVRHLLEILVNDVGYEAISSKVKKGLEGLKVACYYGCLVVRPKLGFDDPEFPQSLDRLMESLGAEPTPFHLKSRCCGGALILPEEGLVQGLIHKLLENALAGGAECIVTVCPLCHTNLDAYQAKVNRRFKTNYHLPVLYLPQLMGLAFGIDSGSLDLEKLMISPKKVLESFY